MRVVSGPYRFVPHPVYLGNLVVALGLLLCAAPPAPAANDEWAAFAAAPAQPPPPPQPGFAPFATAPSQAMPGASPAERCMADGQLFSMGNAPRGPGLIPPPANGFPSYLPAPSALISGPPPPRQQRWTSNAATEKDAFSDLLGGELGK